jgi:hypothetical protein
MRVPRLNSLSTGCASTDVEALFEPGSIINRRYARPSDATTSGLASKKR